MEGYPDLADRPARILIVDDEPRNRQLLEVMLQPEGFVVLTAQSGEEALAMVTRQPPDLILLDVMMAGTDGYRVASQIKSAPTTKNIPIVMVSALDHREGRMRGLLAGAEDFLSKPVDRAELCVRVRNLLRLKAYGDYYDKYSQALGTEVAARTADLLERTRALEQQATVLTEQAALLDLAQDAIVVRDMSWRIVFWSRGAEKMYGWASSEVLGQITYELLKTEFFESIEHIERKLLRDGQWEGELIHHKRDGTRLIVASRWALQRPAEGTPGRILTINTDITERTQAEADLRIAKDAAEQANRSKSEFLANMSHEIRTPMNGVIGMTDLMLDTDLTLEQRENLGILKSSADALFVVINDIFDFSRIEAGRLTLDLTDFNISDTIGDSAHALAFTAHQKGLELIVDVDAAVPTALRGDPERLRQVLGNLLGNAIKFTQRGEVVLRVTSKAATADAVMLKFSIVDTGVGIPLDRQRSIFEAFTQADGSTTRAYGGTGLGLTISSQLVHLMGGRLWVDSEPGRGSTFYFTASFDLVRATAVVRVVPDPVDLRDCHVLIVDDNATNRRLLEEMVAGWRMVPTPAASAAEALAGMYAARQSGRPFRVVLTDFQMPDVDGCTLAGMVKKDPALAGAAVVMLTSAGQSGDAARCREAGIAAYLPKPVCRSELHAAILMALGL